MNGMDPAQAAVTARLVTLSGRGWPLTEDQEVALSVAALKLWNALRGDSEDDFVEAVVTLANCWPVAPEKETRA